MPDRSGLTHLRQFDRKSANFVGYTPNLGGVSVAMVRAFNKTLTAAGDDLILGEAEIGVYLSGPQQFENLGANPVTITVYDGDPAAGGRICHTLQVTAGNTGDFDLGGAILVIQDGLYVKITGTAPNVACYFLANF